jgi:sortase A
MKNGTARTGKPVRSVLLAAMLVFAALGLWLLFSPAMDKQDALAKQAELLESLDTASSGGAVTEMTAPPTEAISGQPADATASPDSDVSPESEAAPAEPPASVPASEPEAAPVILEPVADTEFPGGVTGIGILTIEKIELRLPVAEGIGEATLKIAPGRVPETAAVGDTGNAVIVGHRNYDYGDMFNRLGEIETGDIIGYKAKSGEEMRFEVFETLEINPGDQSAFIQPTDEAIITLYTCTPVRAATHRLLVRARLLGQ